MKLLSLATLGVIFVFNNAHAKPEYLENYCATANDLNNFKIKASQRENLLAFYNYGGIGNLGVCWWHSRFQRNALYLTIFRPEQPADSVEVVKEKIRKIRMGKEIVIINGFSNLNDFSSLYESLIQRELEKWQKADGIVKFKWVQGLRGKPVLSVDKMKASMDELYNEVVSRKKIMYQKLQVPGVGAHAWLVVDMEKTSDGYNLQIIDSLFPTQNLIYNYRYGMTMFSHDVFESFSPRTEFLNETNRVIDLVRKTCK